MSEGNSETQLSKLESILVVGIIGCMLFATLEFGHLMVDDWLKSWVAQNEFVNRRIVLYGIAFFMSICTGLITTRFAFKFERFGQTINRAFLWYSVILLLGTIAVFVFDCLPEVFAGFIGAGVFAFAIYILQKKYFTKKRIIKNRLEKGKCFSCGITLPINSLYCSACGIQVGTKCSDCNCFTRLMDKYCSNCGAKQE